MKKFFIWASLVFFFLVPVSQFLSIRLLVLLVLFSIFLFRHKSISQVFRQSWDLQLYIIVLMIGLIYSDDIVQGLKILETSFALIAVPFLFCELTYEGKSVSRYSLTSFVIGVLTACLIVFSNSAINFLTTDTFEVFQYYQLTNILGIQPTYMAYYVILSITYIVFELYYNTNLSPHLLTIAALFFFVILLLTGGETTFMSLVLVFSFFLLKYLLDSRSFRETYAIVLVVIIMFGFVFVSNSSYFSSISRDKTDSWERSVLWKAAVDANPSPFLGVGTGDYKLVLNTYYTSRGLTKYANESFNSHNQFIQQYFSNGVLGLLTLLIIIVRPLYLSFKSQNPLGILIMFPFVIYGMTEVFLGRFQGVVFFAICHQIVVSLYYSSKQNFALKAV
ncbi:MAG: O-antigen ligase family protein [Cyclobacteriaceae bacterium]